MKIMITWGFGRRALFWGEAKCSGCISMILNVSHILQPAFFTTHPAILTSFWRAPLHRCQQQMVTMCFLIFLLASASLTPRKPKKQVWTVNSWDEPRCEPWGIEMEKHEQTSNISNSSIKFSAPGPPLAQALLNWAALGGSQPAARGAAWGAPQVERLLCPAWLGDIHGCCCHCCKHYEAKSLNGSLESMETSMKFFRAGKIYSTVFKKHDFDMLWPKRTAFLNFPVQFSLNQLSEATSRPVAPYQGKEKCHKNQLRLVWNTSSKGFAPTSMAGWRISSNINPMALWVDSWDSLSVGRLDGRQVRRVRLKAIHGGYHFPQTLRFLPWRWSLEIAGSIWKLVHFFPWHLAGSG